MTTSWPPVAMILLASICVSELFFAAGATSPLVRSERQQAHRAVAFEVRAQGVIVNAPQFVGEDGLGYQEGDDSFEPATDDSGLAMLPDTNSNVMLPAYQDDNDDGFGDREGDHSFEIAADNSGSTTLPLPGSDPNIALPAAQGDNDANLVAPADASMQPSLPDVLPDAEDVPEKVPTPAAGVLAANDSVSVVEFGSVIAPHETTEGKSSTNEIIKAEASNVNTQVSTVMVGQTDSQDTSPSAAVEQGGTAGRVLPGLLPEAHTHGASNVSARQEPLAASLTEEESTGTDTTAPLASHGHHPQESKQSKTEEDVEEIASGMGISAYEPWATSSRGFSRELRHRMQVQDLATVCVLAVLFAIVVFLSCSSVYQVAEDPSPVLFYSEGTATVPRAVCSGDDVDAFLQAFNGQPQSVRLRIIGRRPGRSDLGPLLNGLERRSRICCPLARPRLRSPVLFDISLELTTFVDPAGGRLPDGDVAALKRFLSSKNALETFTLRKKVNWASWEDIATNVRSRLRSLGFWGDVDVRLEATEEVTICRNHPWANFVRSRATQALAVVSLVGVFVWLPYAWARQKKAKAESHFRIDMDPERYWELVADGLHGIQGFQASPEGHAVQQ